MKRKYRLIGFLILCMPFVLVQADDSCAYVSLPGKEFQFRERAESLQKYGYQNWKREPDTLGKKVEYKDYVSKKGKIQEKPIEAKYDSWFVAILETCEKIYTSAGMRGREKSIGELENHNDIYFLDTLQQANTMAGKTIWANMNGTIQAQTLFTENPDVTHPLAHLEPLEIAGTSTKQFGHGRGSGPLYLLVKKKGGETGYIAFNDRYFFLDNPIDAKWDQATVEIIKQRKIKLGMSERHLLLSWGKPQRINKTVRSTGIHEQWVYGAGQYVYMENGKLTSFQSSR